MNPLYTYCSVQHIHCFLRKCVGRRVCTKCRGWVRDTRVGEKMIWPFLPFPPPSMFVYWPQANTTSVHVMVVIISRGAFSSWSEHISNGIITKVIHQSIFTDFATDQKDTSRHVYQTWSSGYQMWRTLLLHIPVVTVYWIYDMCSRALLTMLLEYPISPAPRGRREAF